MSGPVQEYAVAPGEYAFSILLAPLSSSRDVTAPDAAAQIYAQHRQPAS